MQKLKRIRYWTMSSWNQSSAPAYDLKVPNVIDNDLQDKVFELMEAEGFYDEINDLIEDFNRSTDYVYQAGFNGRSGGYLVLYNGGRTAETIFSDKEFESDKYGHRANADGYGWKSREEAEALGLLNKTIYKVHTYPGRGIDEKEVPGHVLRAFRKLAVDIVKSTEDLARSYVAKKVTRMEPKDVVVMKPC